MQVVYSNDTMLVGIHFESFVVPCVLPWSPPRFAAPLAGDLPRLAVLDDLVSASSPFHLAAEYREEVYGEGENLPRYPSSEEFPSQRRWQRVACQ